MHQEGIVHNDLGLENMMIKVGDQIEAKWLDFGYAREGRDSSTERRWPGGRWHWAAPECRNYNKFGQRSDVWSLGAIFHVLLVGMIPPPTESYITANNFVLDKWVADAGYTKLVDQMLTYEYVRRPPLALVVTRFVCLLEQKPVDKCLAIRY
mmetsp:Transcript_103479/g.183535  ORF Transcript_103479/g.183535 Transcript_103479/m.183535 type:complete len:152 (+) Transcript_103479:786-1241(+)